VSWGQRRVETIENDAASVGRPRGFAVPLTVGQPLQPAAVNVDHVHAAALTVSACDSRARTPRPGTDVEGGV
jgi:hypothetical protein